MEKEHQRNKSPKKPSKQVKLSHKELQELMGYNMQVLRKKNGAWRRK